VPLYCLQSKKGNFVENLLFGCEHPFPARRCSNSNFVSLLRLANIHVTRPFSCVKLFDLNTCFTQDEDDFSDFYDDDNDDMISEDRNQEEGEEMLYWVIEGSLEDGVIE